MLSLTLPFDTSSTFNVLCVGAHSDDIEIELRAKLGEQLEIAAPIFPK